MSLESDSYLYIKQGGNGKGHEEGEMEKDTRKERRKRGRRKTREADRMIIKIEDYLRCSIL